MSILMSLIISLVLVSAQNLPLPPLPYEYDALEPHIDVDTMKIHHLKHHQTYTDKLNGALKKLREDPQHKYLAKMGIDQLLEHLDEVPEGLRKTVQNSGGGYVNHDFFFKSMAPVGGGEPEGQLGVALKTAFGSLIISRRCSRSPHSRCLAQAGLGSYTIARRPRSPSRAPRIKTTLSWGRGLGAAPGPRRVGARLLPEAPEPTQGLRGCLLNVVSWPEVAARYEAVGAEQGRREQGWCEQGGAVITRVIMCPRCEWCAVCEGGVRRQPCGYKENHE